LSPDNPKSSIAIDPQYHNPDNNNDDIIVNNAMNKALKLLKNNSYHFNIFPFPFLSRATSIKLFSTSYFHVCGTCSMPSKIDESRECVVDEELRVKGIIINIYYYHYYY